jgi:hypothetical protein
VRRTGEREKHEPPYRSRSRQINPSVVIQIVTSFCCSFGGGRGVSGLAEDVTRRRNMGRRITLPLIRPTAAVAKPAPSPPPRRRQRGRIVGCDQSRRSRQPIADVARDARLVS